MLHLEGKKFAKLTVIERTVNYKWKCKCECGRTTEVYGWHLTSGRTTSCGCYRGLKPTFDPYINNSDDKQQITFYQAACMYADSRGDWCPSTRQNFIDILRLFDTLKDVNIAGIDNQLMKDIMTYFAQDRYTMERYKKIKYFFNHIFNFAIKNNWISQNPLEDIKDPRKKLNRNDIYWGEKDFAKFINTFGRTRNDNKLKLLYAIGFYAGLRKSEAVALRYCDIDMQQKTLTVHQSYKFNVKCFGDTKTDNSYRTIGICDKLYNYLDNYIRSASIDLDNSTQLLFGDILGPSYIRYHLKAHQAELDVPYITYHRLRHSHVVYLLSSIQSLDMGYIKAVAEHMGADYKTVLDTYMHATYNESSIVKILNKKEEAIPQGERK